MKITSLPFSESFKMEGIDIGDIEGEIEPIAMGTPEGTYPGQFTIPIVRLIQKICGNGRVLHLYSGASRLGEVRVDFDNENATHNMDVFDYMGEFVPETPWDYILLDPPYEGSDELKNWMSYRIPKPLSTDISGRQKFQEFANRHARNVLWYDFCGPIWKGMRRKKVFVVFPGGYRNLRALSHLENINLQPDGSRGLDKWL